MKSISLDELARVIGAKTDGLPTGEITGVSIDSRKIRKGDCFFAIKGNNFDGHDFIAEVIEKGAACCVVSDIDCHDNILKVADTKRALGLLAKYYRKNAGLRLVAVTGSVGKTTTRQIIAHVLSSRFSIWQSPSNFNNDIGLPLTILSAPEDTEIIVAELGSNAFGEIAYLSDIAAPDIAAVTAVEPAHLQGFGNIETIEKEKLSIASGLVPGGIFIDRPWRQLKVTDIHSSGSSSVFTIDNTEITIPLPGTGSIRNAITAWCVCKNLGISLADFASAVKTLGNISMRSQIEQIKSVTIINDCYNANPASMKNALEIIETIAGQKNARKVFICGDMAELGSDSEILHSRLGEDIAKAKIDLLITVGPLSEVAAKSAKKCCDYNLEIKSFDDTISACKNLHKFIKEYDIVLVKGSRSAKLELAAEKVRELFR